MTRISFPKIIASGVLLSMAVFAQAALAASATSDALIILEADGRSFTIQHAIGSEGPLIALEIPETAEQLQLRYLGPNETKHRESVSQSESLVQFWDGVALVHYRHRYEDELTQTGPSTYRLSIPSLPQNFAVENGDITRSSYTWVFPENFELISYSAVSEDMGLWQLADNVLVYEQSERFAVTLTIDFKLSQPGNEASTTQAFTAEEFCVPNPDNLDLCATDADKDSVPDYRDICLSDEVLGSTSSADSGETDEPKDRKELVETEPASEFNWQHALGCQGITHLSLTDVQFPTGYSYLDVSSRKALDRVAEALQASERIFEIAAYTDNRGNTNTNLKLSTKRANTVRYYLLLRGVNPNQVRAAGYGEKFPLLDNSTVEGRRGNRRIEISPIQ